MLSYEYLGSTMVRYQSAVRKIQCVWVWAAAETINSFIIKCGVRITKCWHQLDYYWIGQPFYSTGKIRKTTEMAENFTINWLQKKNHDGFKDKESNRELEKNENGKLML